MYKLAIIDDEYPARKCIYKLLEDSPLAISSIVEAEDSQTAIEKFRSNPPDIMLVDIQMPGIDGLQFIRDMQNLINPYVQFIILTGFNKFKYYKEALNLKVYDYLLKPVKKDELIEAIKKAIAEYEKVKKEYNNVQLLKSMYEEKLYNDFLDFKESYANMEKNIFQNLINPEYKFYISSVIRILNFPNAKIKDIEIICHEIFLSKQTYIIFKRFPNHYVIFLNGRDFASLNIYFQQLLWFCNKSGYSVSIGIGTKKDKLQGLVDSYNEALEASRQFLMSRSDSVFLYSNTQNSRPENLLTENQYKITEKKSIAFISLGNQKALDYVKSMFNPEKYSNFSNYENRFRHFIITIQKIIDENIPDTDLIKEFEHNILIWNSIENMFEWLISQVNELIYQIKISKYDGSYNKINKAIEYLHEHYDDNDISLDFLSSIIPMNKTYFCEIFKMTTGKTYAKYLLDIRMKAAKELMVCNHIKIKEISQRVGFSEPSYFEKVFKKYFGLTPKEYKRRIK